MRVAPQFFRQRPRLFQAQDRHVGRLVVRRVLAGGLAQRGRIGGRVEHVVDHLEGQADRARIGVQRGQFRASSRSLAGKRAQHHRGAQQRAGLQPVHLLQLLAAMSVRPTLARSIAWPPHMPTEPDACGQHAQHRHLARGRQRCRLRPAPGRPAPAARRRPAARSLRRTSHARSVCRGAAHRRPCRACRHAPANTRGSFRPPPPRAPALRRRRPNSAPAANTSSGRTRLPPSSTA